MNKIDPFYRQAIARTNNNDSLDDLDRFKDISYFIYSKNIDSYRNYFKDSAAAGVSLIQNNVNNSLDLKFIETNRIESKICVIL